MLDTLTHYLEGMSSVADRRMLEFMLRPICDRMSTQMLKTAGLVETATSGKKVPKVGATDCYACVQGVLVKKAAGTDMADLVGTVTAAAFNVYCFYIDSAGTLTSAMGTEGATLAAVKWPQMPEGKALMGYIIINPTGTGDFVGGTTGLDAGTVTPNTVYVSTLGPCDPSVLI